MRFATAKPQAPITWAAIVKPKPPTSNSLGVSLFESEHQSSIFTSTSAVTQPTEISVLAPSNPVRRPILPHKNTLEGTIDTCITELGDQPTIKSATIGEDFRMDRVAARARAFALINAKHPKS